ncbi:MAG: hypothetical protein M9962_06570 [Oligoflexia bacterium]|nr:hypothetical protein [Oligoflexia bacterium]
MHPVSMMKPVKRKKTKIAPSSKLDYSHLKMAPKASFKKKVFYVFYLVQPVLQFIAIIALVGVFARCSPLASSTDKTLGDKKEVSQQDQTNKVEDQLKSDLIASSFEELSKNKISFLDFDDGSELFSNSLNLSLAYSNEQVIKFLNAYEQTKRSNANIAILSITLDELEQAHLFQGLPLQINLNEKINQALSANTESSSAVYKLLSALKKKQKLKAKLVLIVDRDYLKANKPDLESITARIKTRLALLENDNQIADSYLELSYMLGNNPIAQKRDAEILHDALSSATSLSIVLE